jgi:arylsulfatase A-like enzyme
MAKIFGLDQGFDSYTEPGKQHFLGTARLGTEWIDQNGDSPFFLFLHNYEVHHPYEPDPKYLEMLGIEYDGELGDVISKELLDEAKRGDVTLDEEDIAYIRAMYDAEIRSMDDGFAYLVDYLEQKGLYDNTMIVFTSDHGEEFNEHGIVGWHSHSLYDELLKVPFIVKYPGNGYGGAVIDQQVRGIDLAPTVLGFLELPIPEQFSGADLTPMVRGDGMEKLEAVSRIDRRVARELSSLRTPQWKLSGLAKRRALYTLDEDPEELWDRALKDSEVAEQLEQRLDEILASREALEPPEVAPSESTLQELRALGYID